ncbi:MAG: hypothetical protein JWL82_194 [Parcubacteria group bacterium]|nr:hypothetical protein [Parcubacteria group bacterium]
MRDSEIFALRGEAHHPWHLYAGVVLIDTEGKVALVKDPDGSYTLPRETMSTDEHFVMATHRLVLEQVQVVPHLIHYLGTLTRPYKRYDGAVTEKTVVYFQANFESAYHGRFGSDDTANGSRLWLAPEEARKMLADQPNGEEVIIDRLTPTKKVVPSLT